MYRKFYLILFVILFLPALVVAQNPVSWSLESDAKGKRLKQNESFKAKMIHIQKSKKGLRNRLFWQNQDPRI